jgi:hypothetical protein
VPRRPDQIPDNIDFAAQELLEAPADQRPAMLENIAKALTRRLLQDNPGIGIHEVRDASPLSLKQFTGESASTAKLSEATNP